MTDNFLKRIDLEFEKTFPCFLDQIVCLNELSKSVINQVDFRKGRFFTLLPDEANMDQLYQFKIMGIIPQNKTKRTSKGGWQKVISLREEISMFLKKELESSREIFIADHDCARRTDGWLKEKPSFVSFYRDEVYYVLNDQNSSQDFQDTLIQSDLRWHMLAVVSKEPYPYQEELPQDYFSKLSKDARYVITTAYDGEGIIFWENS